MDLYERLGVRRAAGGAEIRRAWQRLSRALHPAVNPGDPVAAERYRDAARAFEILADPQRRAAYDRGELAAEPVPPQAEVGFEGFDFEARVRVESVGFREIFEHALPAGRARRPARTSSRRRASASRSRCRAPSAASTSCASRPAGLLAGRARCASIQCRARAARARAACAAAAAT